MEEKESLKIEISGIDFLNDDAEIDVNSLVTFIQEKVERAREEERKKIVKEYRKQFDALSWADPTASIEELYELTFEMMERLYLN